MRRTRLILPVAVLALALAACGESTNGPDRSGLTIRLTDAPGDLDAAFIKISQFVLRTDENDPPIIIDVDPEDAGFFDLLELTGGRVRDVVEDEDVDEGVFSELRMVVAEAYVILKDGRVFATPGADLPSGVEADGELKCPSCSQSGLKVHFDDDGLVIGENAVITIDFDAARSFGHEAGKSGKWVMHPVLRATAETVFLGNIAGDVTLATGITIPATCGGAAADITFFKPLAIMGTDTISGTTVTGGAYTIANLLPGNYSLSFIKDITYTNGDSLTFAATATPASVTVAQKATADADYQITAATCH